MTKKTRVLEGYIHNLPIFGGFFIAGGLIFAFGVLNSGNAANWYQNYFYFKAIGAVLGYLWESLWNPGGNVTINFNKSTFSEDEKALDHLVRKYRSNILMALPPLIFLFVDFMVSRMHSQSVEPTSSGYLASVVIGAFFTLTTCAGVKYLSAWWNIRRNLKKEFQS